MFACGFLHFTYSLPSKPAPDAVEGDGIIVLTGAPSRIAVGLDLLEKHCAGRLLISGVYQKTTGTRIQTMVDGDPALFECCVDIDHDALDTIGNARQAAQWAEEHKFSRLIIVTSTYHMPRSLMEFHRAMPEARLVAYPVPISDTPDGDWWRSPQVARLYLSEYAKYVFALVRNRIDDLT